MLYAWSSLTDPFGLRYQSSLVFDKVGAIPVGLADWHPGSGMSVLSDGYQLDFQFVWARAEHFLLPASEAHYVAILNPVQDSPISVGRS